MIVHEYEGWTHKDDSCADEDKYEDEEDIPVPPKKQKKTRPKPKTIEEISTIDQRND